MMKRVTVVVALTGPPAYNASVCFAEVPGYRRIDLFNPLQEQTMADFLITKPKDPSSSGGTLDTLTLLTGGLATGVKGTFAATLKMQLVSAKVYRGTDVVPDTPPM